MASDVRKPPVGAVLKLHKQGVRGSCGWCGEPVADKTPARGWLKFWHDACSYEMGIIEQPGLARDAVFARDHGICVDCKEDWGDAVRLVPEFYVGEHHAFRYTDSPDVTLGPDRKRLVHLNTHGGAPYVSLKAISLWHVDHKIPLWKVAHMPPLQRIEYFKLANLITRCERCHSFKTKREAAERAKFDRHDPDAVDKQIGLFEQPKRRWGKRKMESDKRPWPKRPMRR